MFEGAIDSDGAVFRSRCGATRSPGMSARRECKKSIRAFWRLYRVGGELGVKLTRVGHAFIVPLTLRTRLPSSFAVHSYLADVGAIPRCNRT